LAICHCPLAISRRFGHADRTARSRSLCTGDGDWFKAWLLTQKLAATTAKRLSFARTLLHVARQHKRIDENPFVEVKIPMANVSARQRFVNREMTRKLLSAANPTWQTILALVC